MVGGVSSFSSSKALAPVMLGTIAGYAASAILVSAQDYSPGDAMISADASIAGAMAGSAISRLTGGDFRVCLRNAAIGSMLGVAAGHVLTSEIDATGGQGGLNLLYTLCGGAAGMGIAAAAISGENANSWLWTLGAAGAIAGFTLSYPDISNNQYAAKDISVDFKLNPAALGWQPHPADPRPMELMRLSVNF